MDKIDQIYEEMLKNERTKLEESNRSIIDEMNDRLNILEEKIKELEGK